MKARVLVGLLGVLLCGFLGIASHLQAQPIYVDPDDSTYAAIAYSPSTGAWGYGYNCSSRAQAENIALSHCKAPDAEIVAWVNNGFVALALGDDRGVYGYGYHWGDGASAAEAMRIALQNCQNRTTGAHVVVCVCSYDVPPILP